MLPCNDNNQVQAWRTDRRGGPEGPGPMFKGGWRPSSRSLHLEFLHVYNIIPEWGPSKPKEKPSKKLPNKKAPAAGGTHVQGWSRSLFVGRPPRTSASEGGRALIQFTSRPRSLAKYSARHLRRTHTHTHRSHIIAAIIGNASTHTCESESESTSVSARASYAEPHECGGLVLVSRVHIRRSREGRPERA